MHSICSCLECVWCFSLGCVQLESTAVYVLPVCGQFWLCDCKLDDIDYTHAYMCSTCSMFVCVSLTDICHLCSVSKSAYCCWLIDVRTDTSVYVRFSYISVKLLKRDYTVSQLRTQCLTLSASASVQTFVNVWLPNNFMSTDFRRWKNENWGWIEYRDLKLLKTK